MAALKPREVSQGDWKQGERAGAEAGECTAGEDQAKGDWPRVSQGLGQQLLTALRKTGKIEVDGGLGG